MDATGPASAPTPPVMTASRSGGTEQGFGAMLGLLLGAGAAGASNDAAASGDGAPNGVVPPAVSASPSPIGGKVRLQGKPGEEIVPDAGMDAVKVEDVSGPPAPTEAMAAPADPAPDITPPADQASPAATAFPTPPATTSPPQPRAAIAALPVAAALPRVAPTTGSSPRTDDVPPIGGALPAVSTPTPPTRPARAAEHGASHRAGADPAPIPKADDAAPTEAPSTTPLLRPTEPPTIPGGTALTSPHLPVTTDTTAELRDAPSPVPTNTPVALGPAPPAPDLAVPSATRPAARDAPARQVAPVAIALSLDPAATGRIALQLDPAELGRVEVVVERTRESASVHVAAERPETLALLARDGAQLDRALRDAGIGGDGGRSLSFSLLSDGGARGGAGDPRGGGGRSWRDTPPTRTEPPPARALTTLLDIAI